MAHVISKAVSTVIAGAFVLGAVLAQATPAVAADEGALSRGGQIYDKWYKVVGEKAPKKAHKLYPKDKKYAKKPGANWRCKECHGWDYMGKDGAYAKGKHSSGIKGINGMAGTDVKKIVAVLKGDHGYGGKMSDDDLNDVAMFVSAGQVDMNKYIDRKTKKPIGGDAKKGANYFNTVCARCHGEDGAKPKEMGKSLASQMSNPWEVMHKIANGQPDEKMPALRAFGMQPIVDILAYIETLPKKKLK